MLGAAPSVQHKHVAKISRLCIVLTNENKNRPKAKKDHYNMFGSSEEPTFQRFPSIYKLCLSSLDPSCGSFTQMLFNHWLPLNLTPWQLIANHLGSFTNHLFAFLPSDQWHVLLSTEILFCNDPAEGSELVAKDKLNCLSRCVRYR